MFRSNPLAASSILFSADVAHQSSASRLVVIDAGVENAQQLVSGMALDAAVLLLDAARDGVAQITSALQQQPNVAQLHIVAHGAPGTLYLGNGELSLTNFAAHSPALATWFSNPEAELLLYGCYVAAGDAGEEFVLKLQAVTGAKVAASSTRIGSRSLGGNWSLDVTTADFSPELAFSAAAQAHYSGVLDWFEAEKLLADATVNNIPGNLDPSTTSQGDQDSFDQFGSSVAIFDGFAIVGVPDNTDVIDPATGLLVPGNDVGSVYVFQVDPNDGSWNRDEILVASDPIFNAFFGQSVDASKIPGSDDLYLVVGAPGARSPSPSTGSPDEITGGAYVFKRDAATGVWSEVQKLTYTDDGPATNGILSNRALDEFGTSVGIDGRNIVIGAPNDTRSANEFETGAIYIFETPGIGSDWVQVGGTITNPSSSTAVANGASFDRFGQSVAIADGLIIAGSPNAEVANPSAPDGLVKAGAAFIYRQDANGSWDVNNPQQIIASDTRSTAQQLGEDGDLFGTSVDIVEGFAIVGAPGNNITESTQNPSILDPGSAFIFRDEAGSFIQSQQLTGNDGVLRAGDQFGFSVAIDDGVAIVGSYTEEVDLPGVDPDNGYVDPTFVNPVSPDEANPNQIPAPRLPKPGVAYVYELSDDGNSWEQEDRITGGDRINGDQFGSAVDVYTSDAGGSTAVIGASTKNLIRDANDFALPTPVGQVGTDADLSQAGAAYVFRSQPQLTAVVPNVFFVNDPLVQGTNPTAPGVNQLELTLVYDQPMNQTIAPTITFPNSTENPLDTVALAGNSAWIAPNTFVARYNLTDINRELINIDVAVDGGVGVGGSLQLPASPPNPIVTDIFSIDTLNPSITPYEAFLYDGNGSAFVAPQFVNRPFAVFGKFSEPIDPATFTVDALGVANGFVNSLSLSPDRQTFSYVVNPTVEGQIFTDVPTFVDPDFVSAVTDLRGNPSAPVDFIERIYDVTPPEVTLEALDPDNPTQLLVGPLNRPFTVRARFSEPVVGFELSDITLTPGLLTGNFIEVPGSSSQEYQFTVDPVTQFTNTNAFLALSVGAGQLTDRATNPNNASPQLNVSYDGFRPVATTFAIQSGSLNTEGEVEGEFLVDVVFNEDVLGFEVGDIAVQNGTVTALEIISTTQYLLRVRPIAEGPVVLNLTENTVADLAKNTNQPGGPVSVVFNPPVPEVVSVTPSIPVLTDSDAGQELVLTVVWSKEMDTTAANFPTIGFKTAEDPAGSIVEIPGGTWSSDGKVFEKRFTIADSNLDIEDIDILVSGGTDSGGALQDPNPTVVEDVFGVSMVNPLLTLSADKSTSPFTVTATFSEDVSGFELADVETTNAVATNLVAVSASEYTFTLTPDSSTDPVSISVSDGAATDLSGNFNTAASLELDDVNDPAVVLAPETEAVLGNRSVVFASATGNSIVISDPDAVASSLIKVDLRANQGLISLSGLTGLTLEVGDGLGDERIVLTGTLTDINAALEGARFKPLNKTGDASLSVIVDDQGNTGDGGPQFSGKTVQIPVTFNPEQDFDRDGFEDIFWTKSNAGIVETAIWSLEKTSPTTYEKESLQLRSSDPRLSSDWEAVGTYDFDDDGNVDILWRRPSTFQNAIWFMDGRDKQSSVFYAPQNAVDNNRASKWRMEDVADFDGDDQAEVLWRDTVSGQVVIWKMDGLEFQQSLVVDLTGIGQSADGFLPLKWQFGATGDFNGDGRDDILWRNVEDGQNAVWELDGNELLASSFATPLVPGSGVPSDWQIIGSGDYNGDGNADIAWRKGSQNVIWEMDGLNRTAGIAIDSLNQNWTGIS